MIECYGIIYIGFDQIEEWKDIKYKDIIPNKYEVSNIGRIRDKNTKKILKGMNRKNEKGYCRVTL